MKVRALVAQDLAFLVIALLVVSPALSASALAGQALVTRLPLWLAAALAPLLVPLFLAAMAATALGLRLTFPRLRPGNYPLRGHPQSRAWLLHFALQRVLHLPPWIQLYLSFATLRTLLLRALGARAPFHLHTSTDAAILDVSLLEVGPGTLFGGGCTVSAHFVEADRLTLAPVKLGAEVQLLGGAVVSPGVTIGDDAVIGPETRLFPGVTVGAGAHLGMGCVIFNDARVGENAVLGHHVVVEHGARIGDGAVVASGARIAKGTEVAAGARVPVSWRHGS